MVGLIAATGLRVDELQALRWRSVDLEFGTLPYLNRFTKVSFQLPKTPRALRTFLGGCMRFAGCAHCERLAKTGDGMEEGVNERYAARIAARQPRVIDASSESILRETG